MGLNKSLENNLWGEYEQHLGSDLTSALRVARRGVRLSTESGDLREAGIWQRAVSNVLYLQGKYKRAAEAARVAIRLQRYDHYQRALSYIALGKMQTFAGEYRSAVAAFRKAVEIGNSFGGDLYLWSHLYVARGILFRRTAKVDRAIIDYEGAFQLFLDQGCYWRAVLCLNNLAVILTEVEQYEEAERRLLEAFDLISRESHRHTEACVNDSFGTLCIRTDRYQEAEWYLRRAEKEFESLGDSSQLTLALIHLSELHERAQRFDKSIDCAVRALCLAQEIGDREMRRQADRQLDSAIHAQVRHETTVKLERIVGL